jgi:hypothetical protein
VEKPPNRQRNNNDTNPDLLGIGNNPDDFFGGGNAKVFSLGEMPDMLGMGGPGEMKKGKKKGTEGNGGYPALF